MLVFQYIAHWLVQCHYRMATLNEILLCSSTLCCRLWYLCWWKLLSYCLRVWYDYRKHSSSINEANGFLRLSCSQFPDLKIANLSYLKFLPIIFWAIQIECKILPLLWRHYECNIFFILPFFLFWKKIKPTRNLLHPLHINTCWQHGWRAFLCVWISNMTVILDSI